MANAVWRKVDISVGWGQGSCESWEFNNKLDELANIINPIWGLFISGYEIHPFIWTFNAIKYTKYGTVSIKLQSHIYCRVLTLYKLHGTNLKLQVKVF